jgi:glycosyltransferase involved in cell wall biosynthesis
VLKVHINPTAEQVQADNGVGQVVLAQHKYLPQYGIELVGPEAADVIACHIQQGDLRRVDVLHCHGLYWSDTEHAKYQTWHHEANARIVDACRKAVAITVPSDWVAEPFRRDMRLTPHVIGHGIDLDAWTPAESKGYVLWNKNRGEDVCDPQPITDLAKRGVLSVTTFAPLGDVPGTLTVVGSQPHARMKELVRHADVYLATTRETFGIGTLEALAAGVPVLGYAWGGTAEIVQHEVNGYLVAPGDIDGLLVGLEWLRAHPEAREAARERASRYTWQAAMEQYAAVYHEAAERVRSRGRVSVVITNYNYGEYVSEAIESALGQADEVIVVDDGSTDASAQTIARYADRVHAIVQPNAGVAAARNNGVAAATGDYIVCLDADDKLDDRYIPACRDALDADRGLGVAYTGLGLIQPDGQVQPNAWPPAFDWTSQATPRVPPSNCIPCAAMFRRTMWTRAGGYKQVYAPGEDTEFFTRGLSVGFDALRVTEEPLFHYRTHAGSASRTKEYRPIDTWHPWMRDQKYPMAAPSTVPPLVKSYADPLISVVIPCGPGHAKYLPAALDSLLGQTLRDWEVIVVDDQSARDDVAVAKALRPYPFVRDTVTPHGSGPAAARNAGLALARAPLVLFLDADDYLIPEALEQMALAYIESGGQYIYTDWYALRNGEMIGHETPEYRQSAWLEQGQHAVTCLLETQHARGVGGFDERMRGWEDWDFFVKLAISGVCGRRLPMALLVYRQDTGTVRERSLAAKDELLGVLRDRYAAFATGEREMSSCCGGNADTLLKAKQVLAMANGDLPFVPEGSPLADSGIQEPEVVRLEFTGTTKGSIGYMGRASGQTYYGGDNVHDKFVNVDPRDVEHLVGLGVWKVVSQPRPVRVVPRVDTVPALPTETAPLSNGVERPMLDLTDDMAAEAEVNRQAAELAKKTRAQK